MGTMHCQACSRTENYKGLNALWQVAVVRDRWNHNAVRSGAIKVEPKNL